MGAFIGRVLLLGNYVNDRQQSMQRFCNIFESELPKRGLKVEVIRPETVFGRFFPGTRGVGKWLGYFDKFVAFRPRFRRRLRQMSAGDVLHICDHSNAMYVHDALGVAHLVTCHDLIAIRSALGEFPENRVRTTGRIFQDLILRGLRKARRTVCISQATRADLLRIAKIEPAGLSVAHAGLNYPYKRMDRGEAQRIVGRQNFILHVGGNQWYKNRGGVVRIFSELSKRNPSSLELVLVGEAWDEALRAEVRVSGCEEKIHEVVGCSNELLNAYYSASEMLLFPSLIEGFGWPPIEAQTSGTVAVVSDISIMREIGGEAAVFVEPRNPAAAAEVIANFMRNGDRSEYVRRGFDNARRFSTDKMIDAYLDEYAAAASA